MKPLYGRLYGRRGGLAAPSFALCAITAALAAGTVAAFPASAQNGNRPAGTAASDGVEARVGMARTYVVVRALRDAGGLPTEGRDKNMGAQFAAGLRKYLGDASQNRFDVEGGGGGSSDAAEASRPPRNARVLTVEGDLSRTEDGKGGGPFLAVLRLYQEKNGNGPRKLLAQWAGVADNYRFLTGNLDNRSDIDKEGLLGELGKRVAGAASFARGNAAFDAFIDRAAQTKRVLATLQPENDENSGGGGGASIAAPVLRSGQGYRVRVASQDGGAVYVVRDEGDRLLPLFVPEGADERRYVDPGKPLLVPGNRSDAWIAPRTDQAMEQTLIVLVRRDEAGVKRPAGSAPPAGGAAETAKPAGTTLTVPTAAAPGFQLASFGGEKIGPAEILAAAQNTTLPVRVLSTGTGDPVNSGPVIGRLTKMLSDDPDGTWTAQRIVVRVVPSGRGNSPRPRGSGTAAPSDVTTPPPPPPAVTVPAPTPKEKP